MPAAGSPSSQLSTVSKRAREALNTDPSVLSEVLAALAVVVGVLAAVVAAVVVAVVAVMVRSAVAAGGG